MRVPNRLLGVRARGAPHTDRLRFMPLDGSSAGLLSEGMYRIRVKMSAAMHVAVKARKGAGTALAEVRNQ